MLVNNDRTIKVRNFCITTYVHHAMQSAVVTFSSKSSDHTLDRIALDAPIRQDSFILLRVVRLSRVRSCAVISRVAIPWDFNPIQQSLRRCLIRLRQT